ncbi:MAG TPA: MFS transporter [Bellilinea sp.]|nr:MFS transporter [Bellilinea sp.]
MTSQVRPPRKLTARASALVREYPSQFWLVIGAMFIDRLGSALLFPFFTLFLTRKFGISMTQVGVIFGLYAISSFVGSMIGGALTDRLGRKVIILFGLVMSASVSLLMGVINDLNVFIPVVIIVGTFSEVASPAHQSLIADLLPEEKRTQGFGILRIVANLAVTIGPLIGGFLASRSYLFLFIADAVSSIITAIILGFTLKETHRPAASSEPQETLAQTFRGYASVMRDSIFMLFLTASLISIIVYQQMNTSLSVYLRDYHGVFEQQFGYILSLNALMVVLFQFSISRWVSRYRPMLIITIGTVFYAVGFGMYGVVKTYALFLAAMAVITIGEMLVSPTSQAVVARLAPEDKRGRYMAAFGFSWIVPTAVGPLLAGVIMDNTNADWLWYICFVLGIIAALAFMGLDINLHRSSYRHVDDRLDILHAVEKGELSAVAAGLRLQELPVGNWARMMDMSVDSSIRQVHFRVTQDGEEPAEFAIPDALIHTAHLHETQLAPELAHFSREDLYQAIQLALDTNEPQQALSGSQTVVIWCEEKGEM